MRGVAAVAVLVTGIGLFTGCQATSSSPAENTPMADLSELSTITETQAQMLALIDEVQTAVSAQVPQSRPWRWNRDWSSGTCTGENAANADGVSLNFPNLLSDRALSEAEWALVFATVKTIATAAGLTEVWSPQDSAGNHDIRFHSSDGRTLIFGQAKRLWSPPGSRAEPNAANHSNADPTAESPCHPTHIPDH